MDEKQANQILESPATRKLVHEILGLAANRDIIDAIKDIDLAGEILKVKLHKSLYGPLRSWAL